MQRPVRQGHSFDDRAINCILFPSLSFFLSFLLSPHAHRSLPPAHCSLVYFHTTRVKRFNGISCCCCCYFCLVVLVCLFLCPLFRISRSSSSSQSSWWSSLFTSTASSVSFCTLIVTFNVTVTCFTSTLPASSSRCFFFFLTLFPFTMNVKRFLHAPCNSWRQRFIVVKKHQNQYKQMYEEHDKKRGEGEKKASYTWNVVSCVCVCASQLADSCVFQFACLISNVVDMFYDASDTREKKIIVKALRSGECLSKNERPSKKM